MEAKLRQQQLCRLSAALEQIGITPWKQAKMVGVNSMEYRKSLRGERGIYEGTLAKLEIILSERVMSLLTSLEFLADDPDF